MIGPGDWPADDLLARRAQRTPDRLALVDADRGDRWDYAALDERADDLARALTSEGVDPGDALGVLSGSRPAFVVLVHAAARLCTTLLPLNAALAPAELRPQVERAGVDLLVCTAETAATAVDVAGGVPVVSLDGPADGQDGANGVVDALAGSAPLPEHEPVDRDWAQLVMFTSGTTGEPKGVRLTAGNLVASATASAFRLGVESGDRWLVCLPMYHMGGLAPALRATQYGTAVVVQRAFDAEATGRVIADRAVTGVSLVPTMLARLLDAGWHPPGHLRFVLLGGAPASDDLLARCEDRGVPVHPTYGTTETASQVATATPEEAFAHPGTVGRPLRNTTVSILADGEPVDPGEPGEIVVDGPTVTPGYLDDAATDAAFGEHGLHTGDLGRRDDDGRLWVLGRLDDVIVTGGENVQPARVADAIREYPAVVDAAVVGLPDAEWGERVAALVVGDVDPDALADHCREHLAGFEVPKTWAVADALPRTASGTVDREAVRERLRE